jgi:long-chain acyl-CoA synthetase
MSNAAHPVWDYAQSGPERVALRDAGGSWSYRTLRDGARVVGGALLRAGVNAGDRVLFVAPSVPEFVAVHYGIHAAGAIAVTANTMSTTPELEYIGDDAGVKLVIGWSGVEVAPQAAAAKLGVPYWPLRHGLAGIGAPVPLVEPHPTDDEDTAAILYTSGTTGKPKGVELTHGNLIAGASIFVTVHGLTPEDRLGTALPLFHAYGQVCVMATALRAGSSLSLLPRFDAESMVAMLRRDELTFLAGVPTMWNGMLHASGDSNQSDFASLRIAASGGAALPVEVSRAFEDRFGCRILEGYGLTESTAAALFHGPDRPRKPGSVGVALPGCEVRIRDEQGTELSAGEVGELYFRGPVVMRRYWNRPEATAEVLQDGWLRTGDLGLVDADGDVRIVGRKKDLVIRGGYNVYPLEVEEVLYQHPDIMEVAVIGIPDDHYGEEVAAVVVLRGGARPDTPALRDWAKERLSAYKVPHLIVYAPELPKGATGKVLKHAIDRGSIRAAAEQTVASPE